MEKLLVVAGLAVAYAIYTRPPPVVTVTVQAHESAPAPPAGPPPTTATAVSSRPVDTFKVAKRPKKHGIFGL